MSFDGTNVVNDLLTTMNETYAEYVAPILDDPSMPAVYPVLAIASGLYLLSRLFDSPGKDSPDSSSDCTSDSESSEDNFSYNPETDSDEEVIGEYFNPDDFTQGPKVPMIGNLNFPAF